MARTLDDDIPPPEVLRKRKFRRRGAASGPKKVDPAVALMREFIGAARDDDAESALDAWRALNAHLEDE